MSCRDALSRRLRVTLTRGRVTVDIPVSDAERQRKRGCLCVCVCVRQRLIVVLVIVINVLCSLLWGLCAAYRTRVCAVDCGLYGDCLAVLNVIVASCRRRTRTRIPTRIQRPHIRTNISFKLIR